MKLSVQQLVQPLATAPNARVVEFDFEGLKFLEQGCHRESDLLWSSVDDEWTTKAHYRPKNGWGIGRRWWSNRSICWASCDAAPHECIGNADSTQLWLMLLNNLKAELLKKWLSRATYVRRQLGHSDHGCLFEKVLH